MRKIKILLLSLLLAFCMAGCSEGSSVAISGSGDETDGKISQNGSGMEGHFIGTGGLYLNKGRRPCDAY